MDVLLCTDVHVTCMVGIMIRVHYVREYNIRAEVCYYFQRSKRFMTSSSAMTVLSELSFYHLPFVIICIQGYIYWNGWNLFVSVGKLYLFSEWWLSWWWAVSIWQAIYKSESFSNVIYSTLWFENYQVRFKSLPSFSSKRLIRITYISLSWPDTPSWVVTHNGILTNMWCRCGFQIAHQT